MYLKILLKLISYVDCNIYAKSHSNGIRLFKLLGEQSSQVWEACLEHDPGFFSALFPGITVLGFSLYSAANARYKEWRAEEKERREEIAREMALWRERPVVLRRSERANHLREEAFEDAIELSDWSRATPTG
jgi:hypothetical protein